MVMKEGGIFPIYGYDEVGQHISSINKPGPQDIFVGWKRKNKMGSNIHTINHV